MDSKYTILGKDRMAYIQEANGYRRRVQFSARLSASAGRRSVEGGDTAIFVLYPVKD